MWTAQLLVWSPLSTSPVPIDAGHRIASGVTETEYTDCVCSPGANSLAVCPRQTAGWFGAIKLLGSLV